MKLIEKSFKIGDVGNADVSVDSALNVEAIVVMRVNIVEELKELAKKTSTPIDDKIIEGLEKFLAAANAVMVIKE